MAEDEQHPKFPETIDALKKSWSTVGSAVGLQPAGVLFFKNIFTIAPGAIGLFSFKEEFDNGSDAFYESAKLKAHALKVMETVNVAISALTDLKTLMPVLKSLGKKHVEYGVYPKHYDIVGAALIQTLAMGLGDAFTPALKAAWVEAQRKHQQLLGVQSTSDGWSPPPADRHARQRVAVWRRVPGRE